MGFFVLLLLFFVGGGSGGCFVGGDWWGEDFEVLICFGFCGGFVCWLLFYCCCLGFLGDFFNVAVGFSPW